MIQASLLDYLKKRFQALIGSLALSDDLQRIIEINEFQALIGSLALNAPSMTLPVRISFQALIGSLAPSNMLIILSSLRCFKPS